jgi:site-specific recombinase XerD
VHSQDKLVNRSNFLLVNEYLDYLLNMKNKSRKTVDRYRFWLRHLLFWAMDQPLTAADRIKPSFLQYVNNLDLALTSKKKIIETVRSLFKWAKLYHSKQFAQLPAYWIEDLTAPNVSHEEDVKDYVSLDEIMEIASLKIDRDNIALWRDQAMSCLLFLSGARAGAATTLPVKAVHLDSELPKIEQKPVLGVHTKNRKSATTFLHNIPELLHVIREWDRFVRSKCPDEHTWYAPIHQQWGEQQLFALKPGMNRATGLNRRLNLLTQMASLPHKSAHKYRHGYAIYGLEHCQTMAQYHALSRNLMHANIAITDGTYVHLEELERGKLLGQISSNPIRQPDGELQAYLARLDKENLHRAITIAADLLVQR